MKAIDDDPYFAIEEWCNRLEDENAELKKQLENIKTAEVRYFEINELGAPMMTYCTYEHHKSELKKYAEFRRVK